MMFTGSEPVSCRWGIRGVGWGQGSHQSRYGGTCIDDSWAWWSGVTERVCVCDTQVLGVGSYVYWSRLVITVGSENIRVCGVGVRSVLEYVYVCRDYGRRPGWYRICRRRLGTLVLVSRSRGWRHRNT